MSKSRHACTPMKFLVSLCNKRPPVEQVPGIWLVKCDTDTMKATPIALTDLNVPAVEGILGMAHGADGLVAMLQAPRMALVWLTASYGVRALRPLELAQAGHS